MANLIHKDVVIDGLKYDLYDDVTAKAAGLENSTTNSIAIPDEVIYEEKQYTVTAVKENAFKDNNGLSQVTFGKNIHTIEAGAFWNCGTSKINLPEGLHTIGDNAFNNNTSLSEITLPSSITTIGVDAFNLVPDATFKYQGENTNIKFLGTSTNDYFALISYKADYNQYTIPSNVRIIAHSAFKENNIITVVNTNQVQYINDCAFQDCKKLERLITNITKTIGGYAFKGCSTLTSVQLSDTLTSIGYQAFMECSSLIEINIPNSVTSIGGAAFHSCGSLQNVQINGKITFINGYCFQNCISLTNINIPDTVTAIYHYAFANCSALKKIIIPNPNAKIVVSGNATETTVFAGAPLEIIEAPAAIIQYMPKDNLKEVTILGDLLKIYSLFKGCITLEKAILADNIEELSSSTFSGCSNLQEITLPKNLKKIGAWSLQGCTKLSNITIPDTVTEVLEGAFSSCTALQSIKIPSSVTSIGPRVLFLCSSLKELTIPFVGAKPDDSYPQYPLGYLFGTGATGENYTPVFSYYYTAQGVTNPENGIRYSVPKSLKTVEILGGQLHLGAFQGCSMLTTIKLPNTVTSLPNYVCSGCKNLTEFICPDEARGGIGYNGFVGCYNLKKLKFPPNITCHEDHSVFVGTSGVTDIEASISVIQCIPKNNLNKVIINSGDNIPEECFKGVVSLVDITIPPSIVSIGQNAFNECGDLNVYIDNIEHWCGIDFGKENSGASNPLDYYYKKDKTKGSKLIINNLLVTKIDKPNVTRIADRAFLGYTKLESIVLDEKVERVEPYSFCRNINLKEATLLRDNVAISSQAFGSCSSLKILKIKGKTATFDQGEQNTFKDVTTLEEIEAPINIVEGIAINNTDLKKVTINSADTINSGLLASCQLIEELTLPYLGETRDSSGNLTHIFGTIPSTLHTVKVTDCNSISEKAFYNCSNLNVIKVGGDSLTTIGSSAFEGCSQLAQIIISDTVTSIGDNILKNCSIIEEITIPFLGPDIQQSKPLEYLFELDFEDGYNNNIPSTLSKVVLTKAISLSNYAFRNCENIKQISIPDSCLSIGNYALLNCNKITEFIARGVVGIGDGAFNNCTKLSSITLNDNLTTIKDNTFLNCESLEQLWLPKELTSIGVNAFANCEKLRTVVFGENINIIAAQAFSRCSILSQVILPESLVSIGNLAFEYCNHLERAIINANSWTLGQNAFPKTTKLYYVNEPTNFNLNNLPNNVYHMQATTRPDLDYLGFSFGGTHSLDDLNVYRTFSSRFDDDLTPDKKDQTAEVPGGHGSYYFGSFDRTRKFNVQFAFDSLTEMQIQKWRRFSNNSNIEDLIFDETPYKVYSAKITGKPVLKYVPFEVDGQKIYKGEGTLEFACYYPYAHTPNENTKRLIWKVIKGSADIGFLDGRLLSNYDEKAFPTKHLWAAASGLPEQEPKLGYNPGDLPAPFVLTTLENVTKDDIIQVGDAKITIKTDTPSPVTWDSKTGLVYYTDAENKKILVPYTGNSVATIPVNTIGIEVEPQNSYLKYDYWYY